MARIGLCLVWAGFWAARVLLTDAPYYFQQPSVKSALRELIGEKPVDQAFSVCMVWLSVEVTVIIKDTVEAGAEMLIAKTPMGLKRRILRGLTEGLSVEELEAMVESIRKTRQEKDGKKNGKEG